MDKTWKFPAKKKQKKNGIECEELITFHISRVISPSQIKIDKSLSSFGNYYVLNSIKKNDRYPVLIHLSLKLLTNTVFPK